MADEVITNVPVLETGELGYKQSEKELYIGTLNGNEKISSKSEIAALQASMENKSNNGHTHSKSEITNMPTSLKNPYPLTIKMDGNSNTTYDGSVTKTVNITPEVIDAARTEHGKHVEFSTDKPLIAGTASVGSAETVARSNHVHPAQTSVSGSSGSCTGNAETATKLQNPININLIGDVVGSASLDGSKDININVTTKAADGSAGTLKRTDITGLTVNLNDYSLSNGTLNEYFIDKKGSAKLTNSPITGVPFLLNVELIRYVSAGDFYSRQQLLTLEYSYERYCINGLWQDWNIELRTNASLEPNQVIIADDTNGIIKTSGYTIETSVPKNAKFTDTTYTSLKNPQPVTLQIEGSTICSYDGSEVKTYNITKKVLGLDKVTNESKSDILANANLTGNPVCNTPNMDDNSTHVANTNFVINNILKNGVLFHEAYTKDLVENEDGSITCTNSDNIYVVEDELITELNNGLALSLYVGVDSIDSIDVIKLKINDLDEKPLIRNDKINVRDWVEGQIFDVRYSYKLDSFIVMNDINVYGGTF